MLAKMLHKLFWQQVKAAGSAVEAGDAKPEATQRKLPTKAQLEPIRAGLTMAFGKIVANEIMESVVYSL